MQDSWSVASMASAARAAQRSWIYSHWNAEFLAVFNVQWTVKGGCHDSSSTFPWLSSFPLPPVVHKREELCTRCLPLACFFPQLSGLSSLNSVSSYFDIFVFEISISKTIKVSPLLPFIGWYYTACARQSVVVERDKCGHWGWCIEDEDSEDTYIDESHM